MKVSRCYNCGSEQHTHYAEENGFALVKCGVCGLLFIENRPDDNEISLSHTHGKHSGIYEFDVTGKFNPGIIPKYHEVLKDLFDGGIDSKKSWLDIGCGHGEFITAVNSYWKDQLIVSGMDPNIRKQTSAQKRGLNVGYFDINTHEERYDIISMLNVFSHIPDPQVFLKSLTKLLNTEGELILETGDTADLPAKDHPRPFQLPNHLSFASESVVVGILERLNYKILCIHKYPVVRFDLIQVARELVKAFLPKYKSRLRYYFGMRKYPKTDMYIRAKLKN